MSLGIDFSDGSRCDGFRLCCFDLELQKAFTDDKQAGLLEQLRSQIRANLQKYMEDEECVPYLPELIKDVLTLLSTTGNYYKYDDLVGQAIQFLTVIAEKFRHNTLFEDPDMMNDICQKVIIPNMQFRDFDECLFEKFAEGFMYLQSERFRPFNVTPRRSVFNLVRALTFHFEVQMTTIFGQYIKEMLVKYSRNPQVEWKSKVAAIFLVAALNPKGQTQKEGATKRAKTVDLMSIQDFYQTHILPELKNPDVNQLPVLKAEAIKYVMILRSQLPVSTVEESLLHLINLVTSNSAVVYSFAASAIEKILLIENTNNTLLKSTVGQTLLRNLFRMLAKPFYTVKSTVGQTLLRNLFGTLAKPAAQENEYIMKAIMRSLSTLQEEILPIMDELLTNFIQIIESVAHNTIKSPFNHYMFESLCLYIRIIGQSSTASVENFEAELLPFFQSMLEHGVSHCIPYVFQVLTVMLDSHTSVTEPYMNLFRLLTTSADSAIWKKSANITPLVKLLLTFIEKFPEQVAASDKLGVLMDVFRKLIASKINDHNGFILMQSLIENMPATEMLKHLKPVFMTLLGRLNYLKTGPRHIYHRNKFLKCLLVYLGSFIIKYGAINFIETIDSIEPNRMAMVLDQIMIANLQKVSRTTDKRICAVGVTKLLCDASEYLINGPYSGYWAPLLQALIQLFDPSEDQSGSDDDESGSDDGEIGSDDDQSGSDDDESEPDDYQSGPDDYQSGSDDDFGELKLGSGIFYMWPSTTCFHLSNRRKTATDTLKETVPDVKMFLVQNLGKLSAANAGKLHPFITTFAPQAPYTKAQSLLFEYLDAANIQPV